MKSMKLLLTLGLFSISASAFSADDPIGPLDESSVRSMLTQQGLDNDATSQIIAALKNDPENKSKEDLKLSTVLFTHGGNMALWVDNDSWNFDAAINYKGQTATVKELYEVYYWNGGLKSEISYKWMWVFIPKETSLRNLDGATFGGKILGRGIAMSTSIFAKSPVAIEAGWVARQGGIGNIFIVAAKVGWGMVGGLSYMTKIQSSKSGITVTKGANIGWPAFSFPKLEFKQKKVL
jgi:hypothetical protein